MPKTPFRTPNDPLIVTSGDLIRGEDATAGTSVLVRGGDSTGGNNVGGSLTLQGGAGFGTGTGGATTISAGSPGASGAGGGVSILASSSLAVSGVGGAVSVTAGDSTGVANAGNITLTPGVAGGSGDDGIVIIGNSTGLQFTETATVPGPTIAATQGRLWVRSDSPNVLVYTDDAGADTVLGAGALSGLPGNIYENLQFYVDAGDRNTYPGTGTSVTDLLGNATTGTLTSVTFEDGGFRFDGSSGDLGFTKGAVLDNLFSGGGTVIVFYRPNTAGEAGEGRLVDTSDSLDEGWWLATISDSLGAQSVRFQRNFDASAGGTWTANNVTDAVSGASVRPVQLGPWSCVAVAYDDSLTTNDPVFYINSLSVAFTENFAPAGNAVSDVGNELVIGNRTADDRTYDGDVGVVLMFDRILSAIEVEMVFNVFASRFGLGFHGLDSTTRNGQRVVIKGGDSSGTTGGSGITDGGDVYIFGGDQTSTSFGRGGDVFIRAGDKTGAGNERGGFLVLRSGTGLVSSEAHFYAGDAGSGSASAQSVFIHGADQGSTGAPGGVLIRGGNAIDTASNRPGGAVSILGGLGDSNGGDVFIRGGGVAAPNVGGTTGDILISTDRNGTGGTSTNTGAITISTTGLGATGSTSGNINIATGSTSAVTGNNPGDITITGGSVTVANSGVFGGQLTLTAGNGNATTSGGGGSISLTAGNNTTTGSPALTGVAGSINLTAGDMSGTGANAFAGNVVVNAGDGVGTNTNGGSVTISAGAGTGTEDGGSIILNPGVAGGTGVDGEVTINGKLTVTGLIDPTGLVLDEQATVPYPTTAAHGTLWVRNDAPNVLVFTDDVGTDYEVAGVGVGATLQTAYVGGNTITTDATNGNFEVSGTQAISLDASIASNFTVDSANLTLSTTTSGTLAVSSASVLDLDSGTASAVTINSGVGSASAGGAIAVVSGAGDGANDGGTITITAGDSGAGATGNGGTVTITAGDAASTNGDGGSIILNPGSLSGAGADGEVTINGKLNVTGGIDPTYLGLNEQVSFPTTAQAGIGYLWVRNDTPTTLLYTDDTGTDFPLASAAISRAGGTALVAGDFALSAGWGTTATVSAIIGTDSRFFIEISPSGAGFTANPTITLTYTDGAWPSAPVPQITDNGSVDGAGGYLAPVFELTSRTTTTAVWTLRSSGVGPSYTPVGGETFKMMVVVVP